MLRFNFLILVIITTSIFSFNPTIADELGYYVEIEVTKHIQQPTEFAQINNTISSMKSLPVVANTVHRDLQELVDLFEIK